MTRRSQKEPLSFIQEPESLFRSNKKAKKKLNFNEVIDIGNLFEEKEHEGPSKEEKPKPEGAMDINEITMEQYMTRTSNNAQMGVQRPAIATEMNFEIKGQFLHLLRETLFSGKDEEDAYKHVDAVVEITDYFNIANTTPDQVMLRVFPITLVGTAKRWIKSEPSSGIATWEDLKAKFIKRFTPPAKIARQKMEIQNFRQRHGESLYEAWERFKEMLQACPNHDLNAQQELQTFYGGLNGATKNLVDSKGPIPQKLPGEIRGIFEELAQHSQQWKSERDDIEITNNGKEDNEAIGAINAKVDDLGRIVNKMTQTMHSIQVGCDNCNGPHLTKECPSKKEEVSMAEVYYSYGNRNGNPNNRKPWLPYDEYVKEKEKAFRQREPGLFTREPLEKPFPQEKKPNLDDIVSRIAIASEKRHEELENMLKRIGATTETAIRNQQASILNIENQLGQISQVLQDRFPGTLPSFTEINPKT